MNADKDKAPLLLCDGDYHVSPAAYDAHRQLVTAAQKAADTFADFEQTLGMLGRKPVAESAHIAGEALRAALAAALAAVDAVEKP